MVLMEECGSAAALSRSAAAPTSAAASRYRHAALRVRHALKVAEGSLFAVTSANMGRPSALDIGKNSDDVPIRKRFCIAFHVTQIIIPNHRRRAFFCQSKQ